MCNHVGNDVGNGVGNGVGREGGRAVDKRWWAARSKLLNRTCRWRPIEIFTNSNKRYHANQPTTTRGGSTTSTSTNLWRKHSGRSLSGRYDAPYFRGACQHVATQPPIVANYRHDLISADNKSAVDVMPRYPRYVSGLTHATHVTILTNSILVGN